MCQPAEKQQQPREHPKTTSKTTETIPKHNPKLTDFQPKNASSEHHALYTYDMTQNPRGIRRVNWGVCHRRDQRRIRPTDLLREMCVVAQLPNPTPPGWCEHMMRVRVHAWRHRCMRKFCLTWTSLQRVMRRAEFEQTDQLFLLLALAVVSPHRPPHVPAYHPLS